MMKKYLLILICFLTAFSFAGCSCSQVSEPGKASSVVTEVSSASNSKPPASSASSGNMSSAVSASSKTASNKAKPPVSSSASSSRPAPQPSQSSAPHPSETSSHQPAGKVTVSGNKVSGKVGSTVNVSFKITADSNMAAANFDVDYDASMLEYVSYKAGSAIDGSMAMGNKTNDGLFKFAFITLSSITDGGEMLSVSFKIKKAGSSNVKITATSCTDSSQQKVPCNTAPATVTGK